MSFDYDDSDPFAVPDDEKSEYETVAQLAKPLLKRRGNIAKREMIAGLRREALTELIPVLPPPDTDIWVVGNGAGAERAHGFNNMAFSFGDFVPHIVKMLGDKDCLAYISTWTMAKTHVDVFLQMLADDRLAHLTMMTDSYFKRRESAIAHTLINGLSASGKGTFLCFKNHAKVIAIQAPDGRTCVVVGSANLSSQPRTESYVLTTAPEIFEFYRTEFFLRMANNAKNQS